jgi:hypothetical protein
VTATPSVSSTSSPSPRPTPAPTAAALSCKLPIASGDAPIDGNPSHGSKGKGGFVAFPQAAISNDGNSLGTYVLGAGKWVPVARSAVSPDGKRYAWAENKGFGAAATSVVHLVDVASGADQPVNLPNAYGIVDFSREGIYLTHVIPASDAPSSGLALLDPAGGGLKQVSTVAHSWQRIASGAAWGTDLDKGDPNPPQGLGPANRVLRLDLTSGAVSNVFTSFGNRVEILGFDSSSNPVLSVANATNYTVRAGANSVYSAAFGELNPVGPAVADANGLWLGSPAGSIWLLPPGGAQLRRAAETGLHPALVAGTCS